MGVGIGVDDAVGVASIIGFVELLVSVFIGIGFRAEDEKRKVDEITKRDMDKTAMVIPIAIGTE